MIGLVMLAGWLPARGQLVLRDFNAAHPVKIMYIGDSVTDDCVHVDAWRFYLELLLPTNSFPFASVGRQFLRPPAVSPTVSMKVIAGPSSPRPARRTRSSMAMPPGILPG